jgi:hypothetical protein
VSADGDGGNASVAVDAEEAALGTQLLFSPPPGTATSTSTSTGGGGGGGGWIDACGLPHRHSQWAVRTSVHGRAPLVYVYRFMDSLHSQLLSQPSSRNFFDPWHQHNQFLSEYAFHRSLLSSALVTNDPKRADFFFVPFYARLAYADKQLASGKLQQRMVAALRSGLLDSPYFRRSGGRDHVLVVSSTRAMEQIYRDAFKLVESSILLKIELGDTRRRSDLRRPNHVALPYYVPWLPRDESTRASTKRFSVCLEASTHGGKAGKARAQLMKVLRDYPGALIRTSDPQRLSRSLLCGSRRRMRMCKFCLVPKGITPSSRRLYEALAAKCVPVVVSDRFVVPFAGSSAGSASGGGGVGRDGFPVDSFMLRVPETDVSKLPQLLDEAMPKYDSMLRALLAYRTAYLYEMPLDGQPPAGGSVCAVVAELARRFGPHLSAWRADSGSGVSGGMQIREGTNASRSTS